LPSSSKSLAVHEGGNIASDESDATPTSDWTAERRCYVKDGVSNGMMFERGQALSPDAMAARHWKSILVVASIAPEANAIRVEDRNLGNLVAIRMVQPQSQFDLRTGVRGATRRKERMTPNGEAEGEVSGKKMHNCQRANTVQVIQAVLGRCPALARVQNEEKAD
jgi:hypothetical protein